MRFLIDPVRIPNDGGVIAQILGSKARSDKDFQRVLAWLEDSIAENRKTLETINDDKALRQHQGAGQCLDEFLSTVSKASDVQRPFTR